MTYFLLQYHRSDLYKIIIVFALILISLQSVAQLSEKNYKIYSVKDSKEVTIKDIAMDMQHVDVLFFGEEHNDSVTHYLENKMLETLYETYKDDIALSMEMFERDVQSIMNEYLIGDIREKNFVKDARAWKNYKDYRPMVEFAKKNKFDVICANAAGRYTNLVGRKGQDALAALPDDSYQNFAPIPFDTASGEYYNKLTGLTSHDALPVKDSLSKKDTSVKAPTSPIMMSGFNMIMAQSLWDATMAYSISQYLKKNKGVKVMQVNGRFHSDEGFAVVTQLKHYQPKAKVLIISTGSDDTFPNIDWRQYTHQGDYIIITDPAVPKSYTD